jgi:hypothetical protein
MDMNTPQPEEQGEQVPCIHLYVMPDGSFKVDQSTGPAPADAQEAASLDEAFELARQMAEAGPTDPAEEEAMAAAQAGYARKAQPPASAPNAGGIFGE